WRLEISYWEALSVDSLLLFAGGLFLLWLLAFGFRREGWQAWKHEQCREAAGCVLLILLAVLFMVFAFLVRAGGGPDLFEDLRKELGGSHESRAMAGAEHESRAMAGAEADDGLAVGLAVYCRRGDRGSLTGHYAF